MKKEGGKNGPTKQSNQRIFGAKSLQISEDEAPRLVGGIVEKGFSDDSPIGSSAPRPAVLPFPVARHRSHGPHWAPKVCNFSGSNDDNGEDEAFTGFDPVAAFANPVQREQKKRLNFSRWREVITSDYPSVTHTGEEHKVLLESQRKNQVKGANVISEKVNRHIGAENGGRLQRRSPDDDAKAQDVNMEGMYPTILELVKNQEHDVSDMDTDGMLSDLENYHHSVRDTEQTALAGNCIQSNEMSENRISESQEEIMQETGPGLLQLKKQNISNFHISSSSSGNLGNKQESISLKSQIDAENHALLERMSASEIAEAQAEIMEKMNPALIEVLKKRGQDKSKKQNGSCPKVETTGGVGNLHGEKNVIDASKLSESDISHKVMTGSEDTQRGLDNNFVQKLRAGHSSLWDAWSKRVEAVRELRFSLDGNVIESDFSQVSETGNVSAYNGYNSENVSERDFLRTEGDPGAAGYTIKEALALTRSVVPGQRSLALHLVASVLDKALHNICQNQVVCALKCASTDRSIDWEAVWAFVLGPEPELALSLRMSLDDNHNSVVLACVKVIQCVLSCDINESFFDISEKIATYQKDIYTAPMFRSRPEIDVGFLHGGFWKYNTKPSNILPFGEDAEGDKPEGEHTIQDDIVVAGLDFAAGLVRMGILPRLCYLLEADPSAAVEEWIISILIAIARHSPTCADAIMKCQRLVQTVVNRFTMKNQMEINPPKIKTVTLLKVLARSDEKICIEFIKHGIFHKVTWYLYRYAISLDHWVKSGRENCKLSSALLVEQLRLWKVCIQYGHCVSYFSNLFPALCIWLNVPTFEKLDENNVLREFAAIAKEAYLVLEALSRRLPNFYSHMHLSNQTVEVAIEDMETWCWSHVGPMVDLALKWMAFSSSPYLSELFDWQKGNQNISVKKHLTASSLLWVISAVMHMLSSVLERVIPEDTISLLGGHVPWLPEFVPMIGLEIIKNRFLSFSQVNDIENGKDLAGGGSFLEYLCRLRHKAEYEASLASVCCLHGLIKVVVSVNKLICLAKTEIHGPSSCCPSFSRESKILADGILESSLVELGTMMTTFIKLIASEWNHVQSVEIFGRGGPAPGVGVGWGASGGGFWSTTILLAEVDTGLLIYLFEIFQIVSAKYASTVEELCPIIHRINSALEICLIVGPRDRFVMDKVLDILLQVPVLKYLDLCIHRFLCLNKGFKPFGWEYKEDDYLQFSNVLASHFRNRWLYVKKKFKVGGENKFVDQKTFKKGSVSLDTIHEDLDASNMTNQEHYSTSVIVEWAYQRLPLPLHWFLSPISTINYSKLPTASNITDCMEDTTDFLDIAKGGLFFLLGIEAMSTFLSSEFHSSVQNVPIIWKLHSLSVILLVGMGVLEEEKSRDVYETLQEVYGQLLDKLWLPDSGEKYGIEFLRFQSEIHESYSTFIETLVEQFTAVSYGDFMYGRQVSIYLHRCVEAPVRLATWDALSNARALELLPPLEKCIAKSEGYLEPVEDDEKILEAYVKSWVSGALDRAATRGSVTFTMVLHHLSSFFFGNYIRDKIPLRNKLAKSLLRDYTRKQQREGMMVDLIRYNMPATCQKPGQDEDLSLRMYEIEKRFKLLKEVCEGNSMLLREVEKLELSFRKEQYIVT